MGGLWYEPDRKLSTLLETIISEYETDRDRYWSDDEQTTQLIRFVDNVAAVLVESSDALLIKEMGVLTGENLSGARQIIEALELSAEVRAKVEILLAWRFATVTDEMASRCLELAELLIREHPGERVLRFLRRLGRCYVVGLFPESIIMCRGVLESVVDEAIQIAGIASDGKMRSRLDTLVSTGNLTVTARNNAWIVWQRGNTAIHNDPEAVGQPLETITMTIGVLRELKA